jgi:hypothetical protein
LEWIEYENRYCVWILNAAASMSAAKYYVN